MRKPNAPESDFSGSSKHRPAGQHVHTTYDGYGEVLAYYTFYPASRILYVDWQGHFTSHDFVQAASTGLLLNEQWQPRGLFHDQRGVSGEWAGDGADLWMKHEWIPGIQAKCPNLRGIALLRDADTPITPANSKVLADLKQEFEFHTFYSFLPAWRWMNERARPPAATT